MELCTRCAINFTITLLWFAQLWRLHHSKIVISTIDTAIAAWPAVMIEIEILSDYLSPNDSYCKSPPSRWQLHHLIYMAPSHMPVLYIFQCANIESGGRQTLVCCIFTVLWVWDEYSGEFQRLGKLISSGISILKLSLITVPLYPLPSILPEILWSILLTPQKNKNWFGIRMEKGKGDKVSADKDYWFMGHMKCFL